MPYEERVVELEGFALVRGFGQISVEQRVEIMRRLAEEPAFTPGMPVIVDSREVEKAISYNDVQRIADAQGLVLSGHPIAFLTNPGSFYGLARVAAARIEMQGGEAEVFTSYDEAIGWIRGKIPRRGESR